MLWWLLLASPVAAQDLARYSYVFLQASPDLGIGISPGIALPTYDPSNILYLQVKSRSRNEFKKTTLFSTPFPAQYQPPPWKWHLVKQIPTFACAW